MSEEYEALSRPVWLSKLRGATTDLTVSESEIDAAAADIDEDPNLIRNGWTPTKLAQYYKSRGVGVTRSGTPDFVPRSYRVRPRKTNSRSNPHRWRRGR